MAMVFFFFKSPLGKFTFLFPLFFYFLFLFLFFNNTNCSCSFLIGLAGSTQPPLHLLGYIFFEFVLSTLLHFSSNFGDSKVVGIVLLSYTLWILQNIKIVNKQNYVCYH